MNSIPLDTPQNQCIVSPNLPHRDVIIDGRKRCGTCKEWKEATSENFGYDAKAKTHLKCRCKQCRAKEQKAYNTTHKEQINERGRQRHRENKERENIQKREYRVENKEAVNARRRANYPVEREKRLASGRKSYAKNKSKIKVTHHNHYVANKQSYRIRDQNRRAIEKRVPGKYTLEDIQTQHKRQKGKCYYCHNKVKWGEHTIDHTIPLSRVAGSDIPANDISYLVIACKPCNSKKKDKLPHEWPEGGRLL